MQRRAPTGRRRQHEARRDSSVVEQSPAHFDRSLRREERSDPFRERRTSSPVGLDHQRIGAEFAEVRGHFVRRLGEREFEALEDVAAHPFQLAQAKKAPLLARQEREPGVLAIGAPESALLDSGSMEQHTLAAHWRAGERHDDAWRGGRWRGGDAR